MAKSTLLAVRCPNCLSRIPVRKNSMEVVCEKCGISYRICWPSASQPMIRGLLTPPPTSVSE